MALALGASLCPQASVSSADVKSARCTERLTALRRRRRQPSGQAPVRAGASAQQVPDLSALEDDEIQKQLAFILDPEPRDPETGIAPYQGPSVDALADEFDIGNYVRIRDGPHGYPVAILQHDSGSEAIVHIHGGAVTSWLDDEGLEMLFLHPTNDYSPHAPIGGGLQLAFPQYGYGMPGSAHGATLPQHGFANRRAFNVAATHAALDDEADVCPGVTLHMASDDDTRRQFPHDWQLLYQVNLSEDDDPIDPNLAGQYEVDVEDEDTPQASSGRGRGKKAAEPEPAADDEGLPDAENERDPVQLNICIEVLNSGDNAFEFQAAAFADMATRDLQYHAQHVRLVGLKGRHCVDFSESSAAPELLFEDMDFTYPVTLPGTRMDRVYAGANVSDLMFCPGDRQHYKIVWRQGFTDAVVAHPDVAEVEWAMGFVTIGAGKVVAPVRLEPGQTWHAEFCLRKVPRYWGRLPFEVDGQPMPEDTDHEPMFVDEDKVV